MITQRTEGSKYTGFRPATEIAKDIRKDIKEAIRLHELPSDLKVSVRSNYYAGGQSIDLTWSSSKGTHEIVCGGHRDTPWSDCVDNCRHDYAMVGLSTLGREVEQTLHEIANAYNYDNSDAVVDYFDTLYYCRPTWNWQVRPSASNLVGLDRKVAETFLTLHFIDRVPANQALEIAQKLEALA
jgi:hypothetical protein